MLCPERASGKVVYRQMKYWLILPAIIVLLCIQLQGQRKIPMPDELPVNDLMTAEIEPFLDQLRYARLEGDYSFRFALEHFPREGSSTTYYGTMWGTWMGGALMNRVHLDTSRQVGESAPQLRLLQRSGADPALWLLHEDGNLYQPSVAESHQPLIEELTFSSFEIQMPFIFWSDYTYEDSLRVKGRPAHVFVMHAPASHQAAGIGGVRIYVDEGFHALLRAEILDTEDEIIKTIKVLSFKRVDGQWIVKSVDLLDARNRDKTRFSVLAAAVGQNIPYAHFLPDSLPVSANPVAEEAYTLTH